MIIGIVFIVLFMVSLIAGLVLWCSKEELKSETRTGGYQQTGTAEEAEMYEK